MKNFWDGFFDELEKKASTNPLVVKPLLRHLKGLGTIGLFGTAGYMGFKGVKTFAGIVDNMTWFPEGRRR